MHFGVTFLIIFGTETRLKNESKKNLTDKEREARLSFVDSDPSCAEAYMFICDSDPNDCELTQEYLRITTKQAELASLANWSPTLGARPSIERFCPDFVQTLS